MKLATFIHNGLEQWGILDETTNTILSAADLEENYFTFLPETINELIDQGEEGLLSLTAAIEKHKEENLIEPIPLSHITLQAPLQLRKNIFCVGKNYAAHVREFEQNEDALLPSKPIIFSKATTALIGPYEDIDSHQNITNSVDYEGEVAVIIGKRGVHIPVTEALDYVFGYTIINDVTARNLQKDHEQWLIGKSLDTFCPMGPCILLNNKEFFDFNLTTHVNGELRQSGNAHDLIFSIAELISTISRGITLEPGDVIATGTPHGVGMGFNPPRFLRAGDEIAITVSHIGTLVNKVK